MYFKLQIPNNDPCPPPQLDICQNLEISHIFANFPLFLTFLPRKSDFNGNSNPNK